MHSAPTKLATARGRRGSAFVVAIIALAVMLLLGLVFVQAGTTSAVNAGRQRDAAVALMLADAAVDFAAWAAADVYETSHWLGPDSTTAVSYTSAVHQVAGGTFQFHATGPYNGVPGLYAVTSTGTTTNGRRQEIFAVMKILPKISAVFDYAVFSDHNLRISGDTIVDGNAGEGGQGIHANGNIKFIGESYEVIGNCTATGKIDNPVCVTGTVEPYGSRIAMPEIDLERYEADADIVYDGDVSLNNVDFGLGTIDDPQIIFVDGVVSLSGNVTGYGTIVSTKGFRVTGTIAYEDGDSALAMLTTGDFRLSGTADIVGLIYAHNVTSEAEFVGVGTPTVHGAIVADVVSINGTLDVTWDPRLKNIVGLPGSEGQIDVVSWERL
jgi:hypothetical protein